MLPPRIPMKITGKMTVKAIETGLLMARRISRQAMAKVALTSRANVAPARPDTAPARGPFEAVAAAIRRGWVVGERRPPPAGGGGPQRAPRDLVLRAFGRGAA